MRVRTGSSPVAEEMKRWREVKGLTQKEAAERLLTSKNSWARWERGVTWPDRAWQARIWQLLRDWHPEGRPGDVVRWYLREYREVHALRQFEAAQRMGVGLRTWQAWEAGERVPGSVARGRIWRFLDREMQEFR